MFSVHWQPLHRGNLGRQTDRDIFSQWGPPTIKIVWDGNKPPYLEDLPSGCKLLWRNYPLSEEFHGGMDLGSTRGAFGSQDIAAIGPCYAPDGLPQNGSCRDKPVSMKRSMAALTPEQAAQVYVDNAIQVADYCATQGFTKDRLLFEGPNEYPVWSMGYVGLARLEKRRLQLMHQAGLHSVVLNLGVGWPGNTGPDTPPIWEWAREMVSEFKNGDYLGTHEYNGFGGIRQNWGWWNGRILKCPYKVPIMITEGNGPDGGVQGPEFAKQGWLNFPGSESQKAQRCIDEMFEYAEAIKPDGRVREIFQYSYDGNRSDWSNFDIRRETFMEIFLPRIKSQGLPVPGKTPVTPPTVATLADALRVEFGAAFSDLSASLPHHATLNYATRPIKNIAVLVLHHTATPQTTSWNTIATYHVNRNGWPGIGYHIGIHVDGKVALLNVPEAISYHSGDASKPGDENANSLAIAAMGNFETEVVPASLMPLVDRAVKCVRNYLGRDVPMLGHKDVASATACPGKNLYALLKTPAPVTLPEQEPLLPVADLMSKCRWWLEESVRQDEQGNPAYAKEIRYSLIKLFYRLENAITGKKTSG